LILDVKEGKLKMPLPVEEKGGEGKDGEKHNENPKTASKDVSNRKSDEDVATAPFILWYHSHSEFLIEKIWNDKEFKEGCRKEIEGAKRCVNTVPRKEVIEFDVFGLREK
jgi:hypothetical protein